MPEHSITVHRNKRIVFDGALIDDFQLPHSYWEAKDSHDNFLFQTPQGTILWQNGQQMLDVDLNDPMELIGALDTFFFHTRGAVYTPQPIGDFYEAYTHKPQEGTTLVNHALNIERVHQDTSGIVLKPLNTTSLPYRISFKI